MAKECIKSACPYCGVGCGVEVKTNGDIVGDNAHPANGGALCVKGSALAESLNMPSRLLYPRVNGQQMDWQSTIDAISDKMYSTIKEHGPQAVGMYVSGQLLTEDYYVANKLMKGFVGSSNIDTNSRLCMSSAVAAHVRAFGEDLVPVDYDDLNFADLIVIVGANTAWTHPIVFRRIQQAREANPNLKLVVIDPRKTVTAEQADLHLQLENDGDVLLFNGLLRYLLDTGSIDTDFIAKYTNDFDALCKEIAKPHYELQAVSEALTINATLLRTFFQWFASSENVISLFCQGVNQSQSGTDKANAIINAHLLTGKIAKEGSGPFSITGQPNAMGGREVGGLANQLAVHRGFDPDSVQQVAQFWNAPNIATQPGLKAVDLFNAVEQGEIKFLWVIATNPAVSMPNSEQIRKALQTCDCVVVSDITAQTDTAYYADILLPAAGWGEKQGMVTNSERCMTRQRQFIQPPGEAKADWWMLSQVGKSLCEKMGVPSGFEFHSEMDVFREYAAMTEINKNTSLQLDISELKSLSDSAYRAWQPKAWPLNGRHVLKDKHTETVAFPTHNGKANLVVACEASSIKPIDSNQANPIQISENQQWWLNSGRQRDQWHTMTRTGHISHLAASEVEPTLYLHPLAAEQAKLKANVIVDVTHPQTKENVKARLAFDEGLSHQQAFMSMHWAGVFGGNNRVNKSMLGLVDPYSGQPAFKSQYVEIQAAEIGSYGLALGIDLSAQRWQYMSLQHVEFTQTRSTSEQNQGVWRFADFECFSKNEIKELIQKQFPNSQVLTLDHLKSWTLLAIIDSKIVAMISVSSSPVVLQADAVIPFIKQPLNIANLLSVLNSTDGKANKLVCSCYRVTESDIVEQLEKAPNMSLRELQNTLNCGKNCGSCLPEVKRYLNEQTIEVMAVK
ncbi:nitrate reductase [Vibrio rumoiensis]|uniref:Nitrite reductase n=1 Tax=Vibrio rumoiensis 1S-45 TaxID=1188252 RepID=A0A1E5DZD7_9VIBR|nr:nitrate reductase [Vibrio rumoiensis]OEF23299.1 nitrite reductase [Vibrio rumoiensis 1S-45]